MYQKTDKIINFSLIIYELFQTQASVFFYNYFHESIYTISFETNHRILIVIKNLQFLLLFAYREMRILIPFL